MNKVIYALLPCSIILTACNSTPTELTPKIGMANPASVYCKEVGGTSSIKKDAQGNEYGMCTLPNGQQVNEWDLFRQANKK